MSNDIISERWAGTAATVAMLSMVAALIIAVCCFIVDPALEQTTRGVGVGIWGASFLFINLFVIIGRHG